MPLRLHYNLEKLSMGLVGAIIVAASIGGLVEIAPLFTIDETVEILGADGQRRWVRLIGEALRDESGAIARIHGEIPDVTDRRWLEEALAESEGKYRLLAEDVAALICEFGCDGAIAFANRAYAEFFGCAETGIEGRSHWDLLSGGEGAAMRERLAAMEPAAPLAEVTVETGAGVVTAPLTVAREDANTVEVRM